MPDAILQSRHLTVTAGRRPLLRDVSLAIPRGGVFALLGPSGAGKSTLLKCFNRLTDLNGLAVSGDILFNGHCTRRANPDELRSRIGIVFQQPVVFPTSIAGNVIFGARRLHPLSREERSALTESALRQAALWDEVKDRLDQPAGVLSTGQQQRLCLARTLAVKPEVILMDEPTSALDPRSTAAIEELIHRLKASLTIVIVTHNLAQARRMADSVGYVFTGDRGGHLVESGPASPLLTSPQSPEASDYLTRTE